MADFAEYINLIKIERGMIMGQRLNVEIWNNGEVLANSYYHWEAFSLSSIELVEKLIDNIDVVSCLNSDLENAIKLLESTGAGISDTEKCNMAKYKELKDISIQDCINRNEGLIFVTPEGIQETRYWAEHTIYIYLDEERIKYDVYRETDRWDYNRAFKEDRHDIAYNDLKEFDYNFDDIKFKDIKRFRRFIDSAKSESFRLKIMPNTVFDCIW